MSLTPPESTPSLGALRVQDLLAQIAAKQPTPGGGAVAGATGALAAALCQMVVSYSLGKKSLAEHQATLEDAVMRLERARAMMLALADEDAAAYGLVNELSRLPEGDSRRLREWAGAVRASVAVPLAVGACATDLLRLMQTLTGATNRHLRSDLAIAACLAAAAARAAMWNVLVNAPGLGDGTERERALAQSRAMTLDADARARAVEDACT